MPFQRFKKGNLYSEEKPFSTPKVPSCKLKKWF